MTIVMDHDTRRFEVRPIPANAAASQQPIRAPAANPPTILLRRRDNAAAPRRVIVVDADARGRFGGERDDFGPGMGLPRVAIAGRRAAPGQGAATLTTSERYRLAGHPRRVVVARGDGGVGGPGGAMGGGGAGGGPGGWDEREQGPREQVAAGEFEPYGYREWLALRNRDRMMRLPASLGVNEDEEWKRKHEKVARMQEYARRPTHGRHHHKSDRQQPVGRKLARQASQQQVDDSGDDNSINVNVKLEQHKRQSKVE
ncbi:hypothetical protein HK101_010293 [Irineochytrium annulatum]|nr:hypothetical protein HK101_010293 [Irineochytrium annulatum]